MSTLTMNERMTNLEALLGGISSKLGLTTPAKVSKPNRAMSPARAKSTSPTLDADPNTVSVQVNAAGGRIKLPKRMFKGKDYLRIDGEKISSLDTDQGRSAPINPEVFGASAGDEIQFSYVGKRAWEYEVVGSSPKRKAVKSTPAKAKREVQDGIPHFELTGNDKKDAKRLIKHIAAVCIKNGNDPKFERNQNIMSTGAFSLDARVCLTTRQNQQARSLRKKLGMTLTTFVNLLNAEVFGEEE